MILTRAQCQVILQDFLLQSKYTWTHSILTAKVTMDWTAESTKTFCRIINWQICFFIANLVLNVEFFKYIKTYKNDFIHKQEQKHALVWIRTLRRDLPSPVFWEFVSPSCGSGDITVCSSCCCSRSTMATMQLMLFPTFTHTLSYTKTSTYKNWNHTTLSETRRHHTHSNLPTPRRRTPCHVGHHPAPDRRDSSHTAARCCARGCCWRLRCTGYGSPAGRILPTPLWARAQTARSGGRQSMRKRQISWCPNDCRLAVFFLFLPHLFRQAAQDLPQPGGVQLLRDGEQLLCEPEDQRLQLGHPCQQLLGSRALLLGVRDTSGEERKEDEENFTNKLNWNRLKSPTSPPV